MIIDAIVLAGGRSSRLSGRPKAALIYRGETLLDHAVNAAIDAEARAIAVVGTQRPGVVDSRIVVTREEPPFGGPAAGIGAGFTALSRANTRPADVILVLACDLPEVRSAVSPVLRSLPLADGVDGVVLTDGGGHQQPLTAVYDSTALAAALESRSRHAPLEGLSMRALIADLRVLTVAAPSGTADDIDTWADAARRGITVPPEFASEIPDDTPDRSTKEES